MCSDNDAKFLHVQRRRIEHDKWCEGCEVGDDPGSTYVMNWIKNYAGLYRIAWNNSLCRGCKNYKECGLLVLKECNRYENIND
jgi:hypothetical protein